MSMYYYDEALTQDFRRILRDGRIHIIPPEEMFDLVAKLESDNVKLPIISLNRTGWSLSGDWSHFMAHEGTTAEISYAEDRSPTVSRLQAIPIRINYQMDVWTETLQENDNIMRELIFYYTLNPTLSVRIPYGLDIEHNFNIFFEPDCEDNSDITEHRNRGRYFRQTMSFYTDDAYLFNVFERGPTVIDPDDVSVEIKTNLTERRNLNA